MRKRQIPSGSPSFPGGSKSRVNRAGDNVRAGNPSTEDLFAIEEWRAAHRAVLNTFQAILRERARSADVIVAQRHKRKRTIFDKLDRLPGMNLSRMDDVAGCRLIFKTSEDLDSFRKKFHGARFKHKRRHAEDPGRYDYIKTPKSTGYRGIHDVYEYEVNSAVGKSLTGLYVEIQYRTLVQHAWATAVEVIGFITASQPKFQQGDTRYEYAMALSSEVLARAHENQKGCFPELDDREIVSRFLAAEKEIGLLSILRGLSGADGEVSAKKNSILIFDRGRALQVKSYRDATEALRALFELEKENPDQDIVLVRADTSDDVRVAFKNYFSDASDFIQLVEDGCTKLTKTRNTQTLYRSQLSD